MTAPCRNVTTAAAGLSAWLAGSSCPDRRGQLRPSFSPATPVVSSGRIKAAGKRPAAQIRWIASESAALSLQPFPKLPLVLLLLRLHDGKITMSAAQTHVHVIARFVTAQIPASYQPTRHAFFFSIRFLPLFPFPEEGSGPPSGKAQEMPAYSVYSNGHFSATTILRPVSGPASTRTIVALKGSHTPDSKLLPDL